MVLDGRKWRKMAGKGLELRSGGWTCLVRLRRSSPHAPSASVGGPRGLRSRQFGCLAPRWTPISDANHGLFLLKGL